MEMIYYILGILTGLAISAILIVSAIYFRVPMERTAKTVASKFSPKGEIMEAGSDELSDWIDELPNEN